MKYWSSQTTSKMLFGIGMIIWILALLLLTVNHQFSCVDSRGCLRSYCNRQSLKEPYKQLVDRKCKK